MRPMNIRGRRLDACLRLLRDEDGIALIMALGIMLVLTISLTAVVFLTASAARDAQRTNAGQKANALAEAGVNNAVAVLNANYPGTGSYPGDSTLLPSRTTTYSTGTATWSGSLVQAPPTAAWSYEWDITSVGDVKNPTGPNTNDVKRTITAVVPVVIPTSASQTSSSSAINFIYAKGDITFGQSVNVKAPIYAGGNLTLTNTATIAEDVPPSLNNPGFQNKVAVAGNLTLLDESIRPTRCTSCPGKLLVQEPHHAPQPLR
jgi:Tfp pilus assembly protein PilX